MRISDLGEFGLIRNIQRLSLRKSSSALIGIGDDAAALKVSSSKTLLVTTDMLLEKIHFDFSFTDFHSLGWKSAAANLSDIAAMGGVPRYCLTSIGIPDHVSVEQIRDFYRGFHSLMKTHKTVLVGGDTCHSAKGMVISITVLGEVDKRNLLSRAGAKPGDRVFVTGTLGDSAAGLEILKKRAKGQGGMIKGAEARPLIAKHIRPVPRVAAGRAIARSRCASAMIDISDGLSSDLAHICEQSGVGAEIHSDRIPISPALMKLSAGLTMPALCYALSGGEDYELLFTVPPRKIKMLQSLRIPVTEIGSVKRGKALTLVEDTGIKKTLQATGYDHFRRMESPQNAQRGRLPL
ncbi:MAG TPA: thiamine-phosphate kinase [Nitrospirota bacterium]|nr:thiamine-phosphate kinase [Nitrospirota bacterium]